MGLCFCSPQEGWFKDGKPTVLLDSYIRYRIEQGDLTTFQLEKAAPFQSGESLESMKLDALRTIPFKCVLCRNPMECCGTCTRICNHRCVQDVLQRVFLLKNVNPIAVNSTLESPKFATYSGLLNLVNEFMRKGYKERYEYSQAVTTEKPPSIINWPASGLCPFCYSQRGVRCSNFPGSYSFEESL